MVIDLVNVKAYRVSLDGFFSVNFRLELFVQPSNAMWRQLDV